MEYLTIPIPPFPYFIVAGNALYHPGDCHRRRSGISCFDLIIVEYGVLYLTDGDSAYTLRANDVLILHPKRTHFGHKASDVPTCFHWLHFQTPEPYLFSETPPADFLSNSATMYHAFQGRLTLPARQSLSPEKAGRLLSLMKSIETFHIDKRRKFSVGNTIPGNELQQQTVFLQILDQLANHPETASDGSIAHAAMQYIRENYRRSFTLEELGRALNCHPTHVIRCMKKESHITPIQAQLQLRIEHAQSLLANPALSCSEIAQYLGFSSSSYFCRTFKKMTSHTPQEYRNKALKKSFENANESRG